VLEHGRLRPGSAPVMAEWYGPKMEKRVEGAPPVTVETPAGSRIIWLLNPGTPFFQIVRQSFAVRQAGPVYYTDLPPEHGEKILGEYRLVW
jgi:hypothetical protein